MKTRYWNYATDHQPRHEYNISGVINLYTSERAAVRACKAWCKSEGLKYDDEMVDEVTDVHLRRSNHPARMPSAAF